MLSCAFPKGFHQRTGGCNRQRGNCNSAETPGHDKASGQQPDNASPLCLIQLYICSEADQQYQYYAEYSKRTAVRVFQNAQFFLLRPPGIKCICCVTKAIQVNAAGNQHAAKHCQCAEQNTSHMEQAAHRPDRPEPCAAEQPDQRKEYHCIPQILFCPVQTFHRKCTIHGKCDQH